MKKLGAWVYSVWARGWLPNLRDLFAFGGLGAACYGIAQVSWPAAWIVGGATLFWLGVFRSGA